MIEKFSLIFTGGSGLLATNWFYSKRNDYKIYLGLNERKIQPHDSNVLSLDYSSESSLINQLEVIRPSILIHTAGITSVEKCEKNPELAYQVNVELSNIVANATKKLGIQLVHISTDHLFEGNTAMLSEEEPVNAINVYGKSKALAEQIVSSNDPGALIIRTNFYAWGTSYRKSFSDQIIDSLRQNQVLNLFDDVYYTPILAENLIKTVHDLLDKKAQGIYHVVSDDRISKYEFGVLIAEEFGLNKSFINKSTIKSHSNLVNRPVDMSLSNKKVRDLLGRNLGTVKQHIEQLCLQESEEKTKQIQLL
jgi:dTDP-4-dehydrorhamnose reductase